MIGYLVEQELGNLLPFERPARDAPDDGRGRSRRPGLRRPDEVRRPDLRRGRRATALAADKGWVVKPDGAHWRRVVPSPRPQRIFEIRPMRWLLEQGAVVICAGGGGIPTMYVPGTRERQLVGVEAVIDKDLASSLLARELDADLFVMATDVDGVYRDWGTAEPGADRPGRHRPSSRRWTSPAGSMGPKVAAAAEFVDRDRQAGRDRLARRDRRARDGSGGHDRSMARAMPTERSSMTTRCPLGGRQAPHRSSSTGPTSA